MVLNQQIVAPALTLSDLAAEANGFVFGQAGYEAGAEDATCGELLAEAQALQSAFYDLLCYQ